MRNIMQAAFKKATEGRRCLPAHVFALGVRILNSLDRAARNESRFPRKPFTTNLSFKTYNQLKSQGIVS